MLDPTELKRIAGYRAADEVEDGMAVGLGTGSTAIHAIHRLGERIRQGLKIVGYPTSEASDKLARELGIPIAPFDERTAADITIDGADEIDPAFNMIKGGGGALLREKVVAQHSKRVIIVVDPGKIVARLGDAWPLPVEVVALMWQVAARDLRELGAEPKLRMRDGKPYVTDNGNYILDAKFPGIPRPAELHAALNARAGIVDNGLFIGLCHRLIVGRPEGPETRDRPQAS